MTNNRRDKPVTKAQIRDRLNQEVEAYLRDGGEIKAVEQGETALQSRLGPLQAPLFTEPRADRTSIADVVARLDQRKEQQRKPASTRKHTSSGRKKRVIYDDFGEAIRTVWE